ncbi:MULTISPECIES: glycosyltransferase family 4 protein [unclassified Novosphingobium]|uniref:glycosyltransferase family 4 protein n=1 Tax=unclassified Novosphingobium TaxID=2644732 RepID=UPI00260088CD|nr:MULTISPECIES: glycosyltransferase family 4 protein [unclassified Novosphingobium]HQV02569.1 glycosyltransferase family 4 protein [Novosphingobium sp.]
MSLPPPAPLIAVCANQAWNLVNFRAGLIAALLGRGFRVQAIAPPDIEMERKLAELGCGFTPVPLDAAGLAPHRDLATLLAFRRIIANLQPAAWLSWTIKPNVYGSLAAGLAGVPAFPNVSGLGTAFIRRNLLTLIAKQLYRTGFRRAPTVFFQNEDDRAEFIGGGIVRTSQAHVLPGSGIDAQAWAPPPGGRPAPRQFLMLSRVVADKGVREYVEAARQVRQFWPDAHFVLMGEIGVANRTAIPRAEVESWIAEGVIEHREPASDVRPHIAGADFIVLPSYREGLSRVLLEAAAMGRPIVTTDVTGCRDIVREGENGFLCAPRDAGSLAAALEKACACADARWQALADAGRARVVEEFSQERVTALYLEAMARSGVIPPQAT